MCLSRLCAREDQPMQYAMVSLHLLWAIRELTKLIRRARVSNMVQIQLLYFVKWCIIGQQIKTMASTCTVFYLVQTHLEGPAHLEGKEIRIALNRLVQANWCSIKIHSIFHNLVHTWLFATVATPVKRSCRVCSFQSRWQIYHHNFL